MTSMAFLNLLMDLVDTEGSFKRLEEISLSIPIWRFRAHIKDMMEYLNIYGTRMDFVSTENSNPLFCHID